MSCLPSPPVARRVGRLEGSLQMASFEVCALLT